MASRMTDHQRRAFLLDGTRTAILSTVRSDGRPHAAPVWFTLDGDDVVFMTGSETVKGRNLQRDGRAVITVDEAVPPYSFVIIEGQVELSADLSEMLPWSIKLGGRYMGDAEAEQFGRRNAVAGELLVRLRPSRITAQAAVAE